MCTSLLVCRLDFISSSFLLISNSSMNPLNQIRSSQPTLDFSYQTLTLSPKAIKFQHHKYTLKLQLTILTIISKIDKKTLTSAHPKYQIIESVYVVSSKNKKFSAFQHRTKSVPLLPVSRTT